MTAVSLTKIAKRGLDLAWWLTAVNSVAVVLWLVLAGFTARRFDMRPVLSVAVRFADGATAQLLPLSSPDSIRVTEPVVRAMRAEVAFESTDRSFQSVAGAIRLVKLGLLLVGVGLMRGFLAAVVGGQVFTNENATRIARLGWLLVASGFVVPLVDLLGFLLLVRRSGITGVPFGMTIGPPYVAAAGALVLILSAAWRYGVELQTDREFTV